MRALESRAVLLVEDDDDGREMLEEGLRIHGADVRSAASGEAALVVLSQWSPDVLVSDLSLPGINGNQLLERARTRPGFGGLLGIALTGHGGAAHRDAAFRAGYSKHLLKPAKLSQLVTAILAVRGTGSAPIWNVRSVLERVNRSAPCRFTSLLRFEENDSLTSVWTYDRENPDNDPFPLDSQIQASYCILVRTLGQTCVIEDAARDPRTVGHTKRDELSTYIGVPLYRPDGTVFGTLCSYDARPLRVDETVRAGHEAATGELAAMLAWLIEQSSA